MLPHLVTPTHPHARNTTIAANDNDEKENTKKNKKNKIMII